jgi:sporulation protein YlmC with PRC-barrel domain
MNAKQIPAFTGLLLLSLGVFRPALAQDGVERTWNPREDRDHFTTTRPGAVRNSNRASQVVGMHVRDYQDRDLGRIDDVVLDFRTGRIAYVVLAVPAQAGDRFVAVPASALSQGNDANRLVLNVDRSQLERAPSFARDSWPDLDRPLPGMEIFGVPTADRDRRYSSYPSDANRPIVETFPRERTDTYTTGQGVAPRYEGSTATERWQTPVTAAPRRSSFRGRIVAVNPETRMLSVEAESGEIRDFVIGDRPNIQLKNSSNPRIIDLKVGFPIVVGYRENPDGTSIAQTIIRTDAP